MKANSDQFSQQAGYYQRFRPHYPDTLFEDLISLVTQRAFAWDVGTGNGQVAARLAPHFQQVLATDISDKQLALGPKISNLEYRKVPAEASGLPSNSVDLITVGQALHWFDHLAFRQEIQRVTKKTCLFAAWGYGLLRIQPEIDAWIDHFYQEVVGDQASKVFHKLDVMISR